ncbi:protein SERAC1 isoform X2 [Cylas formicarius]|uniref:protein SERAC1 isoform X2 n=1 Tax=Cylas formicarius TaxID=197179 RepID=UPI002958B138|nr:protein SERAC1 isoform X2 [Cylas formicarius]
MKIMKFIQKHKRVFKCITLSVMGFSAGWMYYQLNRTRYTLNNAMDTSVLEEMEKNISNKESAEQEIVHIKPFIESKQNNAISKFCDTLKFIYARRLLAVAKSTEKYFRLKAINQLSSLNYLTDWHCELIANMVDPHTAVALARIKHTDERFFLEPPYRYHNYDKDILINAMREFLITVYEKSRHPCVGYFLSKAFVYEHDSSHIVDHDTSCLELSKFIQTEKEVLPLCLESLLHHVSLENYSTDVADLNGLPLLMEVQRRYKDNINITIKLCQILSYMSLHKNLLQSMYTSGWIGILAKWTHHEDIRISVPAAKALANLDRDNEAQYSSSLYLLHPLHKSNYTENADVVFIHGLLGGVFYTWRQRTNNKTKHKQKEHLKLSTKEYIENIKDLIVPDDFEIVWTDIPLNSSQNCAGPFTCESQKIKEYKADDSYTYCWPKDWLANDLKNIRIIGINYDTSLSMWAPLCPLEKEKLTLDERSDMLAQKLLQCNLGNRPIVWITHSMGGLIVKNILSKAFQSDNPDLKRVCTNTKGIVFYSTPHHGSKAASLNQAASLVLWPSVAVQELRENSPKLKQIHEEFLEMTNKIPMKVITFVETKPIVVTAMKFNFVLVEPQSGNPGVGEYYEIPQDHLGICKPESIHFFIKGYCTC